MKSSRPSIGTIAAYSGAFLLLVGVIAVGYESPEDVSGQVSNVTDGSVDTALKAVEVPSVDEVVATGVAAELAERANLPIAKNAANMSVSLSAKSELAQTDTSAVVKPQIIKPTNTSNAPFSITTKKGDTVPSIAAQYNISADTVRWANGLSDTDAVEPGRKLTILPTSGILYTTKSGDSVNSIAEKYKADTNRIVTFNNLELSGIKSGQKIIIPDGRKPAPRPQPAAPAVDQSYSSDMGGGIISSSVGLTAGNRYAAGNCTWYAYERRVQLGLPVGSFWGNANTWASSARAAGLTVSNRPTTGAIFTDQAGYFGHVGIVERVKSNGDIVISEMNNYAYGGFNIVNERTISAGQAAGYQYIK